MLSLPCCVQAFFSKGGSLRTALVRKQLFFPDRRLLQYDCGKLQELDVLLRKLKTGGHRVLIFTQVGWGRWFVGLSVLLLYMLLRKLKTGGHLHAHSKSIVFTKQVQLSKVGILQVATLLCCSMPLLCCCRAVGLFRWPRCLMCWRRSSTCTAMCTCAWTAAQSRSSARCGQPAGRMRLGCDLPQEACSIKAQCY
jgi:hypothetical protein